MREDVPMPDVVIGADGVARCPWAVSDPLNLAYHDEEWGRPVRGEAAWFERLTLEAFQSGLSWLTILRKRESFRAAFADFDPEVVAAYDDSDRARLMADAGIVRNRLKVDAAIANARATVDLREDGGLEALLLSFVPDETPRPRTSEEAPTTSPESTALSRELKRRGFTFVGPTTMHALMEATGLVDSHLLACHRRGVGGRWGR
jgi:DNA-3-methyladenine glycosylase I